MKTFCNVENYDELLNKFSKIKGFNEYVETNNIDISDMRTVCKLIDQKIKKNIISLEKKLELAGDDKEIKKVVTEEVNKEVKKGIKSIVKKDLKDMKNMKNMKNASPELKKK